MEQIFGLILCKIYVQLQLHTNLNGMTCAATT